ncbi:MAG: thiol peroxidase [Candidatus Omnitrophica bacterium]|nr:thiol peroxidase [Candidatus Omnitrophota bacterium]
MPDLSDKVTMKGNPVTLEGNTVQIGSDAPDCTLTANDLSDFKLSSLKGKTVILSVVPSLDTPVCDLQTKRFNQEASGLGAQVVVLTISMDLPFAQKRWCANTGAENVITLSDHKEAAFGKAYGLVVKGVRLLARAVMIVDGEGTLRYKQIVPEITTEPNYEDVLKALKNL